MEEEVSSFKVWEATIGDTFKAYCEAFAESGLHKEDYEYLEQMIKITMQFLKSKREKNDN